MLDESQAMEHIEQKAQKEGFKMDQQAHLLLKTIGHHHKQRIDTDYIGDADSATESRQPQNLVFKTWLRLKLIRWEIEIKRGSKNPQRGTVGA